MLKAGKQALIAKAHTFVSKRNSFCWKLEKPLTFFKRFFQQYISTKIHYTPQEKHKAFRHCYLIIYMKTFTKRFTCFPIISGPIIFVEGMFGQSDKQNAGSLRYGAAKLKFYNFKGF